MDYALLEAFSKLFIGQPYLHRKSNLGDYVASHFYEDLLELGRSTKLVNAIQTRRSVVNLRNAVTGRSARRGDGTFGELVPAAFALTPDGFKVARGNVATIEIGAEVKILAKAMIKQIDRVISDLNRQVEHFKSSGGNPICVGFVGVNFASTYVSFEGDRAYQTDGKKYKHPIQEAVAAEQRVLQGKRGFDEFQILRYRATNVEPYPFEWVNLQTTREEYSALLTRVSREYDRRF